MFGIIIRENKGYFDFEHGPCEPIHRVTGRHLGGIIEAKFNKTDL